MFRGAIVRPEDLWDEKASYWSAQEKQLFSSISTLEKDTDSDGRADEVTLENFGSIEAEIG